VALDSTLENIFRVVLGRFLRTLSWGECLEHYREYRHLAELDKTFRNDVRRMLRETFLFLPKNIFFHINSLKWNLESLPTLTQVVFITYVVDYAVINVTKGIVLQPRWRIHTLTKHSFMNLGNFYELAIN
jgi:hypothetical protein